MQNVTIEKQKLLDSLKENRKNHRAAFLKALEGYKITVIEELEKSLQDAKEGKRFHHFIRLAEPQDQTPEYDQVISMLEMSVDTEVTLTSQEFAWFVMDNWQWKQAFSCSNSGYVEKAGATLESFGRALT